MCETGREVARQCSLDRGTAQEMEGRCVTLRSTCPLCGTKGEFGRVYPGPWRMGWCRRCRLQFVMEGPKGERVDLGPLESHYKEESYVEGYIGPEAPYEKEVRRFLDLLEGHLGTMRESPVFCDVGCSVGIALEEAKRRGWRPVGVDISDKAAETARRRTGCQVWVTDVEQLLRESVPPVDMLYLNHIMEHFPNPLGVLMNLASLAKAGSLVWINVPNVYSIQRNALARLGRTASLGLGEHFCFFSSRSLKNLARAAGYDVLWEGGTYFDWHWKYVPVQLAARLLRVYDALCLIGRKAS